MSDDGAAAGIMLAIEVLAEQLIKSGAIERATFIAELKVAYNSLGQDQSEEYGGKLVHTLIRHLERGPPKATR